MGDFTELFSREKPYNPVDRAYIWCLFSLHWYWLKPLGLRCKVSILSFLSKLLFHIFENGFSANEAKFIFLISKERGGGKKEKYRTRIQINGPTEHCRVDGPWPEIYIAIKMIFLFPLSAANLSMLMHVNLCSVSVIWNGSSSQK